MGNKCTVLVGRDHALKETLDRIAHALHNQGLRIIRLPEGTAGEHSQVPPKDFESYLSDTTVIVVSSRTRIDKNIIQRSPKLRGIVFPSIGYNSCDIEAAAEKGVVVVNGVTPENYESMAESTVMLMSALMLELTKKQDWLKRMRPNPQASEFTSRMLKGKTIGLIGFGRIAKETVKRLQGWDVDRFLVYTRSVQSSEYQNVMFCPLDTLLRESDVVSIHCPLNAQTKNLLGSKQFAAMKKDSVLVNTSRGGVVDEKALYHALSEGDISAAAIDTFSVEPLPKDSALRQLDNIILTQHNIGHTRELFESLVPKAVKNVKDILSGVVPADAVNRHLMGNYAETDGGSPMRAACN